MICIIMIMINTSKEKSNDDNYYQDINDSTDNNSHTSDNVTSDKVKNVVTDSNSRNNNMIQVNYSTS